VTTREAQRGALVTAGNATPLFKIAATDLVRVFVQVPQDLAPSVRNGLDAHVTVREYAARVFDGKVAHAAGALDPATRTMNTEVRVPNADGALFAGMYAQVSLTLPVPHTIYELPATALVTDAKGVRVVTVTPEGTLKLVKVVVERDTGPSVQIASGLEATDRVVKLASADLTDGRPVDVVQAAPPPAAKK
jgi:RND family efflux transporter MFP subunit